MMPTRHDPAPDVILLATSTLLATETNQPHKAHLCWHGLVNCPICAPRRNPK